jgi:hypothetical protein
VVLCDRHPIEVLAIRPRRTRVGGAIERTLVGRMTPWPDAIVILDAPASTLHARKAEHPVSTIERWQRGYLDVFVPKGAVVVSTAGPVEDAVSAVSSVAWDALRKRRRW